MRSLSSFAVKTFSITLLISLLVWQILTSQTLAGGLETIEKRDRLIVGVKNNLPPLGFLDRSGSLKGFEIDISEQLAKELLGNLPISVELRSLSNSERFAALWLDQVDLLVAQVTLTENRARLMEFSLPYYVDSTVLIARKGTNNDFRQPEDLIGVLKGSETIAILQGSFPNAALIGTESYKTGLEALKLGKIKGFAGDAIILLEWLKQNPEFEQVGSKLAFHSLAIALPRGEQYQTLRSRVFKIVEGWRQSGWLKDRASFWGLP
jgi:polar amino acid transport system substrate-binding protein